MIRVVFFTCATGSYKKFIVPYITSVLLNNNESYAEILVDETFKLTEEQNKFLVSNFYGRYLLRTLDKTWDEWRTHKRRAQTIRWLLQPETYGEFTYIGDVDILFLDKDVWRDHYNNAVLLAKPYSNIVRPYPYNTKLSGLHFVVTKEYYNKVNKSVLQHYKTVIKNKFHFSEKWLDEYVLYTIVKSKIGLSNNLNKQINDKIVGDYRPVHGVHISQNRDINGWGITQLRAIQYKELLNNEIWLAAKRIFSNEYITL